MVKGIGIPVEVKTNIYGTDVEFTLRPPSKKQQKEIEKMADSIDVDKPCKKAREKYKTVSEMLKTYDLENATPEERKEYRELLKEKNELLKKLEDVCESEDDVKENIFTKAIGNMIFSDNKDEITRLITENIDAESGFYWLLGIYGDAVKKQSEE